MDEPRILVHTSHQPMRWSDMDTLGHVNNTVYFRYMEQAHMVSTDRATGRPVALPELVRTLLPAAG